MDLNATSRWDWSDPPPGRARFSVLCVDNEPDILEVAALALSKDGDFDIKTALSGQAALAMLSVEGYRPDVVLLDVMMPGFDGPEFLAHLRTLSRLRDLPVIFLTARVRATEAVWLTSLGAIGVIGKPFDPMTLAAQVRGLLGVHA